jgi:hypothetical protein
MCRCRYTPVTPANERTLPLSCLHVFQPRCHFLTDTHSFDFLLTSARIAFQVAAALWATATASELSVSPALVAYLTTVILWTVPLALHVLGSNLSASGASAEQMLLGALYRWRYRNHAMGTLALALYLLAGPLLQVPQPHPCIDRVLREFRHLLWDATSCHNAAPLTHTNPSVITAVSQSAGATRSLSTERAFCVSPALSRVLQVMSAFAALVVVRRWIQLRRKWPPSHSTSTSAALLAPPDSKADVAGMRPY